MSAIGVLTMVNQKESQPDAQPKQEMLNWDAVERLDWHLWTLSILLIFVLGISLLSFMFPSVFWVTSNSTLDSSQRAFIGFCTLMGLTLIYLFQRQSTVRKLKRQLYEARVAMATAERVAVADAFLNLPGSDQFHDTLAMEYRRASTLGAHLAGVLLTAPKSSSETIGSMTRRIRITLRQGEKMFRISDHSLGIILPKMKLAEVRSFLWQIESSAEISNLEIETRSTVYPEEVSSLSEMEGCLRGMEARG
ncbi:MAG: hypothetical protein A3F68_05040 [Acidobacteria bacterium RIFCSPLOWO2_12_FULL_54_10]|nr:MAG: hypothetical protein A3F68_05040 [Acidobacteria bacterium RIFCSPLOWO2_12_FULL_54_10]